MKNKFILLILVFFSLYLAVNAFSGSVLIDGNSVSLPVLIDTKFLDSKPVLIFSDELTEKNSDLLESIDQILFFNSDWNDLAVEFASLGTLFSSRNSKIFVNGEGVYELWLDTSEIKYGQEFEARVKVDRSFTEPEFLNNEGRFINIGEWDLKTASHSIRVDLFSKVGKKEALNKSSYKIFLVKTKEREFWQDLIYKKLNNSSLGLSYFMDKEKADIFVNSPERKTYNLKLKVNPIIYDSEVKREAYNDISWKEEINNWKLGFLHDEIILPFIFRKEGFFLQELIGRRSFSYTKKDMRLLVFNPKGERIKSILEFSVNSYKKARTLEVSLNNTIVSRLAVPVLKDGFTKFGIELLLIPGINEIRLSSKEAPEILKPANTLGSGKKLVSFKFEDMGLKFFGRVLDPASALPKGNAGVVPQGSFLDLAFSQSEPVILSRNTEVDLEEFPLFNLEGEFKQTSQARVFTFLGIDYNGDGAIDGYLGLTDSGEYDILKLAKQKWDYSNENNHQYTLRKIILFASASEKGKKDPKNLEFFRLRKLNFYNNQSLILTEDRDIFRNLRIEELGVRSEILQTKETISVSGYFENKSSEIRVHIPVSNQEIEEFPYFYFGYELKESKNQGINLGLLVTENGQERFIRLSENQFTRLDKEIEAFIKGLIPPRAEIKDLVIILSKTDIGFPLGYNKYFFKISKPQFYHKFPYPLKTKELISKFSSLILRIKPLINLADKYFYLADFKNGTGFANLGKKVLFKQVELNRGFHAYKKLDSGVFDVEWALLEEGNERPDKEAGKSANIVFKRINPAKYLVKVEGASEPFWLVFSESFHNQWKLYKCEEIGGRSQEFDDIVAEYPDLGVKEARHLISFMPKDLGFLFKKPLKIPHHMVNGYANAWYIEPEKSGLGSNFVLTLYFVPQSFFYLGLIVSASAFIICFIWFIFYSVWKFIIRIYSKER